MDPRIQLITLGVRDVAASRRFYVDGLGWPTTFEVPGDITFIQVGPGRLLGLFGADALANDSHTPLTSGGSPPFSLAQIVATEPEVDAALAAAIDAGGRVVKPAQHAEFGGYHAYFADPDGFLWEVATNSGWVEAADDGDPGPDRRIGVVPTRVRGETCPAAGRVGPAVALWLGWIRAPGLDQADLGRRRHRAGSAPAR